MTTVPAPNVDAGAAMGLFRVEVDGVACWGNNGFWGITVLACPDFEVVIAGMDATTMGNGTAELFDATLPALAACQAQR